MKFELSDQNIADLFFVYGYLSARKHMSKAHYERFGKLCERLDKEQHEAASR